MKYNSDIIQAQEYEQEFMSCDDIELHEKTIECNSLKLDLKFARQETNYWKIMYEYCVQDAELLVGYKRNNYV